MQYEGDSGYTCSDLEKLVRGFKITDDETYIIVHKRFIRTISWFELPKVMALHEFDALDGF